MSAAASKKRDHLTKVCRIFQWIEGKDERFASAIRNLCMEGALSPGHSSPGLTFLYPEDAAYRAEICDKAYSDDADSAVTMIKALIIPDASTTLPTSPAAPSAATTASCTKSRASSAT